MRSARLKSLLTKDLLELLGVSEDRLRHAIRRRHLHPVRLSNGLFLWPPESVAEAERFFEWRATRKQKQSGKRSDGGQVKAQVTREIQEAENGTD